jgi:hypothetical protein
MNWHAQLQGLPTRSLQDEHEHRSKDAAARWAREARREDCTLVAWYRLRTSRGRST